MVKIKMLIHPGGQASVGDTLPVIRLRQSAPDLEMRMDKRFMNTGGSKITREPGVYQRKLKNTSNYRGYHGFKMQDLVEPDTHVEPYLGSTGDYSWRSKVARVLKARRTGEMFLPLPGGYEAVGTPRGGLVPFSTTILPGIEVEFGGQDLNTLTLPAKGLGITSGKAAGFMK